MRLPILIAAGFLAAGAASAQAPPGENPPRTTVVCLDVSGRSLPAVCRAPASRLDPREDICLCGRGGIQVTAPVCPPGVRPPAETVELDRARRVGLQTGTLAGVTFRGQPICVAPRNPISGY
jgi:hypothetical protein